MKTVITYGTFDLFHIGHLNMLERLRDLGDELIVGVSTDAFNTLKGKKSLFSFDERMRIIGALSCVDKVIPEHNWQQKSQDILQYQADVFGIGEDWKGRFDDLESLCQVVYLPRTPTISTTELKQVLSGVNQQAIQQIKAGLDGVLSIVKALE